VIDKELADERFHLYIGDLDASYHYDHPQVWPEMRFLAEQIRKGDWIADVGAHHGVSAMLSSGCCPLGARGRSHVSPHMLRCGALLDT